MAASRRSPSESASRASSDMSLATSQAIGSLSAQSDGSSRFVNTTGLGVASTSPISNIVARTRLIYEPTNPEAFLNEQNLQQCLETLASAAEVSIDEFNIGQSSSRSEIAGVIAGNVRSESPANPVIDPPPLVDMDAPIASPEEVSSQESAIELTPPGLFTQGIEVDPNEYPHPLRVIPDLSAATRLADSNLLDFLRIIPFPQLKQLGYVKISATYGGHELSPYVQFLVKFAHEYYATLPTIGVSVPCLSLLHYFLRITTVQTVRAPSAEIQELYLSVSSLELDDLVITTARVFIDPNLVDSSDLLSVMPLNVCESRVNSVLVDLPEIYSVYNLLAHFCHGGLSCIDPIPEVIKSFPPLSEYISRVTSGSASLSAFRLGIPPRDALLPSASFQPIRHTQAAPRPTVEQPSQTQANVTPHTSAPPQTVSRYRSLGSSSRDAPQVRSANPRSEASSVLLDQGLPPRNQIIRDTTTFRQGVQADMSLSEDIKLCKEEIVQCKQEIRENRSVLNEQKLILDTLVSKVDQLVSRLEITNNAMSVMIAQASAGNLGDREILNRALLTPIGPSASTIIHSAPVQTPLTSTSLSQVFSRLKNYTPHGENSESLSTDVRDLLVQHGYANFASTITAQTIENPRARSRIISKFESLPRR